jgi:peptidoglycan/xylan/chitin deacetylase (PgdA/CDA1 family)
MLRVLTYHRVAEPDPGLSDPTLISARPADFVRQMEHLARNYNAISIEQLLHSIESREPLPEKSVLVTFDDGYCDFEETAWPVLQRFGIPVTLFVPTAYPGDSGRMFWWDQLYGAFMCSPRPEMHFAQLGRLPLRDQNERIASLRMTKRYLKSIAHRDAMPLVGQICDSLAARPTNGPRILSWARLRKLSLEGVAICAHTRTHPLMTRLSPEEVRWEVRGAQEDLYRELGIALPVFAYPSGAHDPTIARILRAEDFSLAFTTLDGHNDIRSADLLRLRRTNITLRTSAAVFRFRLLRVGTYIDMMRHGTFRQAVSTSSR